MRNRKRGWGWTALAVVGVGSLSWAAQPPEESLQARIAALEAQVQLLKAQQQANQQVQATQQAVAEDARQRSESTLTGGWKNGKFILQSEDGRFSLSPGIQFQFRYVANASDIAGNADIQDGFEVRRAKFGFSGNAFSRDLDYNFVLTTNRSGGAVTLEEAWVRYAFAGSWAVRGGMFKDPLSHEQMTSSKTQLAADRSLLNEMLIGGDNFVEGIGLLYGNKDDALHVELAYTDGSQSHNTDFRNTEVPSDSSLGTRSNFGLAGRAEYKFFGDWKNYSDFTALKTEHDLLVLGGGVDFTQNGSEDALLHTIDLQYELGGGWSFYTAYVGRSTDAGTGSRYDGGVLAQAACLLDKNWEIFGRYAYLKLDSASVAAGASTDLHEITAGLNYYVEGHNAKFTLDAVYLPAGSPANQTGIGILASDDAEIVLRGQFQLLL